MKPCGSKAHLVLEDVQTRIKRSKQLNKYSNSVAALKRLKQVGHRETLLNKIKNEANVRKPELKVYRSKYDVTVKPNLFY